MGKTSVLKLRKGKRQCRPDRRKAVHTVAGGQQHRHIMPCKHLIFQQRLPASPARRCRHGRKLPVSAPGGNSDFLEPGLRIAGVGIKTSTTLGTCARWERHILLVGTRHGHPVVKCDCRPYTEMRIRGITTLRGFTRRFHQCQFVGGQFVVSQILKSDNYISLFHKCKSNLHNGYALRPTTPPDGAQPQAAYKVNA